MDEGNRVLGDVPWRWPSYLSMENDYGFSNLRSLEEVMPENLKLWEGLLQDAEVRNGVKPDEGRNMACVPACGGGGRRGGGVCGQTTTWAFERKGNKNPVFI